MVIHITIPLVFVEDEILIEYIPRQIIAG